MLAAVFGRIGGISELSHAIKNGAKAAIKAIFYMIFIKLNWLLFILA
jgi:hypothetical protein